MESLIKHPNRMKQLISFEGMNTLGGRNICPTDIDMFIDYNGQAFIYGDAKNGDVDVSYGQKLAYENVVNSHTEGGKGACAIIFRHNTPQNDNVVAKDCIISEYYICKFWHKPKNEITLKEGIEKLETLFTEKGFVL